MPIKWLDINWFRGEILIQGGVVANTDGPTLPEDLSVEVVTDTPLILIVNITGFNLPLTDITWFIDGVQATNGTGNISVNMNSPPATSTFVLDPVQFPIE